MCQEFVIFIICLSEDFFSFYLDLTQYFKHSRCTFIIIYVSLSHDGTNAVPVYENDKVWILVVVSTKNVKFPLAESLAKSN